MWPYRPRRLTELLDPDEISFLLGQGIVETLRSDVTLVEPDVENKPSPGGGARKIELPEASLPLHESPFCHFFRRGRVSGKLAFPGANEECESCELRYGARILENAARSTASSTLTSARCHMGLLDFAAPVIIRGHTLATIIAGRRVESEDDRSRVTKKVGKLGKLTRAEVRSIEESGAEAVAAIRPHDEEAREILFREIERIPRADATLGETLERVAQLLAKLAEGKFALARREWEERVLTGIVTEGSELPQRRANILKWVDGAVARLQRSLLAISSRSSRVSRRIWAAKTDLFGFSHNVDWRARSASSFVVRRPFSNSTPETSPRPPSLSTSASIVRWTHAPRSSDPFARSRAALSTGRAT